MLHGLAAPDWRGEIRVGRTIGSSAAATKQLTNNQRVVKAGFHKRVFLCILKCSRA